MVTLEELIQNNGVAPVFAPTSPGAQPPGGGPVGNPVPTPGGETVIDLPTIDVYPPGQEPVPVAGEAGGAAPGVGPAVDTTGAPAVEAVPGAPSPTGAPSGPPTNLQEIIDQFGGPGTAQMMENAPVPTDPNEFLKDYAKSFAHKLAERAGQAVDLVTAQGLVETAVEHLGTMIVQHPDLIEHPKRTTEIFKGLLEAAGVDKPDPEKFGAELGAEQVDSLIMLGALRGAGPYLQSLRGTNMFKRFAQRMGEAIVNHPYLAVATDVLGATPGGVVGRRTSGSDLGSIPGAMIGGIAAGKMISTPTKIAQAVKRSWTRPPQAPSAFANEAADPLNAKVFAENQVEGDILRIENSIGAAINSIPRPAMTAKNLQVEVYKGLQKAESIADGVEKQYWSRVTGLNRPLPESDFLATLAKTQTQMERDFHRSEVPYKSFRDIAYLWRDLTDTTRAVPTIQQVRAQMRALRRDINNEWGGVVQGRQPNEPLIKNMNELISMLRTKIAQTDPSNVPMQQAIAMSTEVHNLFSRGVLLKVLASRRTGEAAVHPTITVDQLMKEVEGLSDVMRMSRRMQGSAPWRRIPGQPNAYPGVIGADAQHLKQLELDIAESLRATWHEGIDNATTGARVDPATAARMLRKLDAEIKPIAKVSAQMQRAATQLTTLMEERKTITDSALASYAGMDAQKAIKYVISNPDPAANARDLMSTFRGNPHALEGFRTGLIDEFLMRNTKNGRVDSIRLQENLARPDMRRLIEAVWTQPSGAPDTAAIARLDKMIDVAVRLDRGDIKSYTQGVLRPVSRIISGIVGAHAGRMVGSITNQPTIQVPGMIASAMRAQSESMWNKWKPNVLLANAIWDPHWERMLLKQEPTTTKEMNQQLRDVRKLVRRGEALRSYEQRRWETDATSIPEEAGPVQHAPQKFVEWASQPDLEFGDYIGNLGKQMNPKGFDAMLTQHPPSTNIEDRRNLSGPDLLKGEMQRNFVGTHDTPGHRQTSTHDAVSASTIESTVRPALSDPDWLSKYQSVPMPRPRPKRR